MKHLNSLTVAIFLLLVAITMLVFDVKVITKTVYSEYERCKNLGGEYHAYSDNKNSFTQWCEINKEIDF